MVMPRSVWRSFVPDVTRYLLLAWAQASLTRRCACHSLISTGWCQLGRAAAEDGVLMPRRAWRSLVPDVFRYLLLPWDEASLARRCACQARISEGCCQSGRASADDGVLMPRRAWRSLVPEVLRYFFEASLSRRWACHNLISTGCCQLGRAVAEDGVFMPGRAWRVG